MSEDLAQACGGSAEVELGSGYEAARHDGPPHAFATLASALEHLEGSCRDSTRPYLRVNSGRVMGSFLIVGGRKQDASCHCPAPQLPPQDQALLDSWRFEDPRLRRLQACVAADVPQAGHVGYDGNEAPRMRG